MQHLESGVGAVGVGLKHSCSALWLLLAPHCSLRGSGGCSASSISWWQLSLGNEWFWCLCPLPTCDQDQADVPIYYCGTDLSLQLSKCLRPPQRFLCLLLKAALC